MRNDTSTAHIKQYLKHFSCIVQASKYLDKYLSSAKLEALLQGRRIPDAHDDV